MDELKIVTELAKDLVAQLVEKRIKKKLECSMDITLNELEAVVTEETAKVHLSVDVEMSYEDCLKLCRKIIKK